MTTLNKHRVLPQNTDAEKAIIGSLLLSPEIMDSTIEIITSSDFGNFRLAKIFECITILYNEDKPFDIISLTSNLRERNLLERVGGAAVVTSLMNAIPSAANFKNYAKIIKEKSILRQLITFGSNIVDKSFNNYDCESLLGEIENDITNIKNANVANEDYYDMSSLCHETFQYIEHLYENKGKLVGITSGLTDIDRLTAGFQPGDLILLAGRPSAGKTTAAINFAVSAAQTGKKIAIVSMEMNGKLLVLKMLSAAAKLDSNETRQGRIGDDDWKKISYGFSQISNLPIYIIDNSIMGAQTFINIRSKLRRIKNKLGLDMIVIDYLQLMESFSGGKIENRQNEVSKISRGLKLLAGEMNIPILALSQLSRALESRSDKRPMLSDLRESGCLTYDTLIINKKTNELVPIGSMVGKKFKTLAMSNNYKMKTFDVTNCWESGMKKVYELETQSGRKIKASANHPFYKIGAWKRLDELNVGDLIATPRKINYSNKNSISKCEAAFIAHLIGDGCILTSHAYQYTSGDEKCLKLMSKLAYKIFKIKTRLVKQKNWWHLFFPSPYRLARGTRNPITLFYEKLKIERVRANKKEIPQIILESNSEIISTFLKHLWSTDGTISKSNNTYNISYSTTSEKISNQIQHLLLKLNILSSITSFNKLKYKTNYNVNVYGKSEQTKFINKIGIFGKKEFNSNEIKKHYKKIKANPNNDIIPKEIFDIINLSNHKTKYNPSRINMKKINKKIMNLFLFDLYESDLYWDKIKSIKYIGEEMTYDMTVNKVHNFIANDIIVKNSLEQDADLVTFVHRPGYFEKDDPDVSKTETEFIVAKQRNGPLGAVFLQFQPEYNRFVQMTKQKGDECYD